jgi:hypothetical protein
LLCQTCSKKGLCSQLCPEAEAYANQDRVAGREYFHFSEPRYKSGFDPAEEYPDFSKTEWKILALLKKKFSREEVCAILEISRQNLRSNLSKIKGKCKGFPDLFE